MVSYQLVTLTSAIISLTFSFFVVMTALLFPSMLINKIFMEIILCITLANISANWPYALGYYPLNGSVLCAFEGFCNLFFYPCCWTYTTALTYLLRSLLWTGRHRVSRRRLHLICLGLPLLFALLMLITNTYGARPYDSGVEVCSYGGKYNIIGNIEHDVTYDGFLALNLLLMLVWVCQIASLTKTNPTLAKSPSFTLIIRALIYYPIALFVCWFPHVVIEFGGFPNYDQVAPIADAMKILQGALAAMIFFRHSAEARKRWANLINGLIRDIGIVAIRLGCCRYCCCCYCCKSCFQKHFIDGRSLQTPLLSSYLNSNDSQALTRSHGSTGYGNSSSVDIENRKDTGRSRNDTNNVDRLMSGSSGGFSPNPFLQETPKPNSPKRGIAEQSSWLSLLSPFASTPLASVDRTDHTHGPSDPSNAISSDGTKSKSDSIAQPMLATSNPSTIADQNSQSSKNVTIPSSKTDQSQGNELPGAAENGIMTDWPQDDWVSEFFQSPQPQLLLQGKSSGSDIGWKSLTEARLRRFERRWGKQANQGTGSTPQNVSDSSSQPSRHHSSSSDNHHLTPAHGRLLGAVWSAIFSNPGSASTLTNPSQSPDTYSEGSRAQSYSSSSYFNRPFITSVASNRSLPRTQLNSAQDRLPRTLTETEMTQSQSPPAASASRDI